MKKSILLLPLVLTACFPVVLPVSNPSNEAPNVYGQWKMQEVAARKPSVGSIFVLNSSNSGFSASSECVEVHGTYALSAEQGITFSNVQEQKKECDSAYAAERQLAKILSTVKTYRFNNRDLVLVNESGATVLVGARLSQAYSQGQSDTMFLKDARRN